LLLNYHHPQSRVQPRRLRLVVRPRLRVRCRNKRRRRRRRRWDPGRSRGEEPRRHKHCAPTRSRHTGGGSRGRLGLRCRMLLPLLPPLLLLPRAAMDWRAALEDGAPQQWKRAVREWRSESVSVGAGRVLRAAQWWLGSLRGTDKAGNTRDVSRHRPKWDSDCCGWSPEQPVKNAIVSSAGKGRNR